MSREWVCYEHGRVHADAEQAVYCQDGEWRETPEPERSEFAKRWDDVMLRARGQHLDQILAMIRALGTCTLDEVDMTTETTGHPAHHVMAGPLYVHPAKPLRASWGLLRWRIQRDCRKRGGHWWHPYTELDWFCCQCGVERDGMPEDGT